MHLYVYKAENIQNMHTDYRREYKVGPYGALQSHILFHKSIHVHACAVLLDHVITYVHTLKELPS